MKSKYNQSKIFWKNAGNIKLAGYSYIIFLQYFFPRKWKKERYPSLLYAKVKSQEPLPHKIPEGLAFYYWEGIKPF